VTLDNRKTIDVRAGEQIIIELEGNPSTGFTWEAEDLDVSISKQVGNAKFRSENPGLIGSGGKMTLTYKAIRAGETTLTLAYCRHGNRR
jgi:inhibitor of cysteine peptidase